MLRQLRQVLVTGKLPVGFFIGAGCPTSIRTKAIAGGEEEALIPDVSALTKYVVAELSKDPKIGGAIKKLLELLMQDGEKEPNIERLLSRTRALGEVAGIGEVRGLSHLELAELDKAICKSITSRVTRDLPEKTPYHSLARFSGADRAFPVAIFTTNYDLLMEQAFERLRIPFFDGFIGSHFPFFDQRAVESDAIPKRWVRFWKLHGSINWRYERARHCVIRGIQSDGTEEQMIHPSHLKYDASRRMPYLIMIDRMRTFLRDTPGPVALFISGYSFGDDHLNEVIIEGLQANPNAACFALQFGEMANYPTAIEIAKSTLNLSIISDDGAFIRGRQGRWALRGSDDASTLGGSFKQIGKATDQDEDALRKFGCKLGDFAGFAALLDELVSAPGE